MAKISELMGILPQDTVGKACRGFQKRIEAAVEAGGDFSE